ncbi:MAG: ATP synthase F0 subunit B [Pseudomonadota bacterium]
MKRLSVLAIATFGTTTPMAFAAGGEGAPNPFAGFLDPTTNVAFFAMATFLLIVWRLGGFKALTGALDKRADTISEQIAEATALREAASKTLAEAERRRREADEQAEAIIKQAKIDSKAMMEEARANLAERVKRREAQAAERIARAEAEATAEVRNIAADAATAAARSLLAADTSVDQFEKAADEIDRALNS